MNTNATTDARLQEQNTANMVLSNHIYEYQKGVRNLVLYTLRRDYAQQAVSKLKRLGIDYVVQEVGSRNVNIFFGRPQCIRAIRNIVTRPLNCLTPEEDFILGTLLGYDVCMQCERYCSRLQQS